MIYKSIFYNWNCTLNYCFIEKVDNLIWKLSWYKSDLLFFFLLSYSNIWGYFLYLMVIL